MTTNMQAGSAKIYQFPSKGRAVTGARRDADRLAAELAALGVSHAALGGSWYHEAAVQEAGQPPKRS